MGENITFSEIGLVSCKEFPKSDLTRTRLPKRVGRQSRARHSPTLSARWRHRRALTLLHRLCLYHEARTATESPPHARPSEYSRTHRKPAPGAERPRCPQRSADPTLQRSKHPVH